MALSSVDRIRLENMLGLLGSEHPGERENAASLIEQFRKQRGLSWSDLLVRQSGGFADPGQPIGESWRVLRPSPLLARRYRGHDTAWRWSMLIGLVLVGLVSLTSALEVHAIQQVAFKATAGKRETMTRDDYSAPVLARLAPRALPASPAAAKGGVPMAFAQGAADRKVWETWRQSDASRLCAGHLWDDQAELKSACATASKLLKEFDQRRHTDREYLSGWNSVPASSQTPNFSASRPLKSTSVSTGTETAH